MATTYSECIPLIDQLNHHDKLRLAQWLIKTIAQEEGINDDDLLEEEHIQHCLAQISQGDYSYSPVFRYAPHGLRNLFLNQNHFIARNKLP